MAIAIRRAKEEDAEAIGRILFEVHAVHHAIRPDLFLEGKRKYDEAEVKVLIDRTPVLVAEDGGFDRFGRIGHDFEVVDKPLIEEKRFIPARNGSIDEVLKRRHDADAEEPFDADVRTEVDVVIGIIQKGDEDIRVGHPADVAEEARNKGNDHVIGKDPANDA